MFSCLFLFAYNFIKLGIFNWVDISLLKNVGGFLIYIK